MKSTKQTKWRVWGFCVTTALAVGCGQTSTMQATAEKSAGGVAVVDLDQIAKQTGQDSAMNRSIEQATASVNDQLKQIRDRLRREYLDELAKLDPAAEPVAENETPAAAQTPEGKAIGQRYDAQMAKVEAQAREKLVKHKASVIEQFRSDVRPVAEKVAKSRGQAIVVTKNDAVVFAFLPQADITEEVAEKLQNQVKPAAHTEP